MNPVASRVLRAARVPVRAPDRNSGSTVFAITAGADGRAYVTGSLTFATARRARDEGLEKFRSCTSRACEVDCSGVTASDSAGLTVLLDWLAMAKRDGRSLRYVNLPKGLIAIAKISEVDELLQTGV
jgi:phospholipid transport system transporter-binding protein